MCDKAVGKIGMDYSTVINVLKFYIGSVSIRGIGVGGVSVNFVCRKST